MNYNMILVFTKSDTCKKKKVVQLRWKFTDRLTFPYGLFHRWLSEVLLHVCFQTATNVLLSFRPEPRAQLLPPQKVPPTHSRLLFIMLEMLLSKTKQKRFLCITPFQYFSWNAQRRSKDIQIVWIYLKQQQQKNTPQKHKFTKPTHSSSFRWWRNQKSSKTP